MSMLTEVICWGLACCSPRWAANCSMVAASRPSVTHTTLHLILPASDSNFGISIQDSNGQHLPVREPFSLANFSANQAHIDVPLSATLVPLGTPKIGLFTAIVTVQILYD